MQLQNGDRDRVLAKLNADDPSGAVALARELLSRHPDDADVLGLLGLALDAAGDAPGAADALRRALACPASSSSVHLRNLANLVAMLFDKRERDEIAKLIQTGWTWPADLVPSPNERQCLHLIADILAALELHAELVAFLFSVLERDCKDWRLLRLTALSLAATGRAEDGLRLASDMTREASPSDRHALLAYLHAKAGHAAEARAARNAYIAGSSTYVAPARPSHRLTVAVVNTAPAPDKMTRSERLLHFNANYPAQILQPLEDRFRFVSVLLGAGPEASAALKAARPDVIVNNAANAEVLRTGENLPRCIEMVEALGVPCINHPKAAAECTRQLNALRFQDVPNMVVPRVSRFVRDPNRIDELIARIERSFTYPLIVRTTAEQEALNLSRIYDRAKLRETLLGLKDMQVYVIDYVGATRLKRCHRRLRAAFVEGSPVLMRADYDRHWIVQGRKRKMRQAFYREHPDLLADADDIIRRPRERLGAAAWSTLETIGRLLPLDVFGMDFDLDEQGRVVFFEANATMNLFSTAPPDFPYPPEADAALLQSLEQLLQRRASLGKAGAYGVLH